VGTKLKLAKEMGIYKGLGVDLVAMCVNDLVCVGAEPLFFLDYYACGRLETAKAVQVVDGMTESLASLHCALVGGETAEMPCVYNEDEFDLAGFSVGVVNRREIIDGSGISLGNKIIGMASSGVHSNGFSLVRKIIADANLDLHKIYPGLKDSLGLTLLTPTLVYVNQVLQIKKNFPILGLAHITGGGLLENIPRILPKSARALLRRKEWPSLPVFDLLQEMGSVTRTEMDRVFNCGIGMAIVVQAQHAEEILNRLNAMGQKSYLIGEIISRPSEQDPQVFIQEN